MPAPSYQLPAMTPGLVRFCSIVTKFLTEMGKLMEEGPTVSEVSVHEGTVL